ncbi:MAG: biopolymer transporter ExbD [Desulfobacteraceae bacterium]|jgi:biopolymer transport protein ExbD
MNYRSRYSNDDESRIDMTPLIDMVFILLIFFIVTTSFVRETGIEVKRPVASTAVKKENASLFLRISPEGRIYLEGNELDIRNVKARMERFLADTPSGSVVIVADTSCPTGITVEVLDACRDAGVKDVSVATKKIEE